MTDPDAFYDKLLHKLGGRQRSDIGELQVADGDNIDAKAFIEELKKYGPVQELDEVLLHRLIDKIIVGSVRSWTVKRFMKSRSVTTSWARSQSKHIPSLFGTSVPDEGGIFLPKSEFTS